MTILSTSHDQNVFRAKLGKYVLKMLSFGSKERTKEPKLECAYFWARLASFGHLGLISDPLIVSEFPSSTMKPMISKDKNHCVVVLEQDIFILV